MLAATRPLPDPCTADSAAVPYRSEGFAEDLGDSHPAARPSPHRQPFAGFAMAQPFGLALIVMLGGCTAPQAQRFAGWEGPPAGLPNGVAALVYPVPQAPFETTPITPVETVGASRSE